MTDTAILTIDAPGALVALAAGDTLTFGRVDDAAPTPGARHLGLSANPRLHLHAGRVDVDEGGWVLTNVGRWLQVRVVEHGGPNRIDLQPGRVVRVPYPRCGVEVATGDETVGFTATCPVVPATPVGGGGEALAGATVGGLGLDREAGYFRAVVALCVPRLLDPQSDEVSSVGEIVRTLNRSGREAERVSPKGVERRLAHVRSKLAIGATDPYGGSVAGLEVRDAARVLADVVLRTGTVTPADLVLVGLAADGAPLPAAPGPDGGRA